MTDLFADPERTAFLIDPEREEVLPAGLDIGLEAVFCMVEAGYDMGFSLDEAAPLTCQPVQDGLFAYCAWAGWKLPRFGSFYRAREDLTFAFPGRTVLVYDDPMAEPRVSLEQIRERVFFENPFDVAFSRHAAARNTTRATTQSEE